VQLAPVRNILKQNVIELPAFKQSQRVTDEHRLATREALRATCLAEVCAGKSSRE
jgi:hypothetical protein